MSQIYIVESILRQKLGEYTYHVDISFGSMPEKGSKVSTEQRWNVGEAMSLNTLAAPGKVI